MWHFRGTPYYLKAQGPRLGLSQALLERAKHNQEIYKVASCLGQLCERYHRASAGRAEPAFAFQELGLIKSALALQEAEVDKLHALAAAGEAMLADASTAMGIDRPPRHFAVVSEYDEIIAGKADPAVDAD